MRKLKYPLESRVKRQLILALNFWISDLFYCLRQNAHFKRCSGWLAIAHRVALYWDKLLRLLLFALTFTSRGKLGEFTPTPHMYLGVSNGLCEHSRACRALRLFASTSRKKGVAFFASLRATQKFGEHEQVSTRLNFASKSSKGKILRAVKNFNGPFITPVLNVILI